MSEKKVIEYLTDYNKSKGWETSKYELVETLLEADTVWEGKDDEHRWYICRPVVKNVDGVYIRFIDYIITGDNSMSDMDLEHDLENAEIVERKERRITEVYYE